MSVLPQSWVRRSTLVALARVANAIFFLLTSTYCLLTYSSFAYQQFIKPHLVSWLTNFVIWNHIGFWLMLLITAWTLLPTFRASRGRLIAASYLTASTIVGMMLIVWPVLPQVENNSRGLILALVALLPPVWLALVDHRVTGATFAPKPSSEARALKAALVGGLVMWVEQLVVIPWRLGQTGEIALSGTGLLFGSAVSAAGHLLIAVAFALAVVAIIRVNRMIGPASNPSGAREYWLIAALSAVIVMLVFDRLVFAAIAFTGRVAWLLSIALGAMMAIVWSGITRLVQHDQEEQASSALEVWLRAVPGTGGRTASMAALAALIVVEFAVLGYIVTFDWDFLVQKLCMVSFWLLAFGYSFSAVAGSIRPLKWPALTAPAVAAFVLFFGATTFAQSRLGEWIGNDSFVPEFVLEGYVSVDPSYRLIHGLLHVDSSEDARFYAYLRAHSLIQHVQVPPIDVDFVTPLMAAPGWKPHIFLFVVDSLRRDYLSPYNAAVQFTPAIGAFANESVVFRRAFTRYGGTGLSVPAIWTGGMLLHKQYVTPFDPMNTLLKLLDAEHYRRLMSMDSVVVQLMAHPPEPEELDRGVKIVDYRLCHTLDDLQSKLQSGAGDPRPVFAYSLPQDLHISHVREEPVPAGASYPGFVAPVAAQIERFDACFGRFVDFLKRARLYDDSLIILTSDHGDSLGEGLRWGHSYTMFAEVARIPLIVHVPPKILAERRADAEAITFSTDITPTLYALTGHPPKDLGPLYGKPFLVSKDADESWRRKDPFVAASSYGGVYAVLRDNGTKLFIADGVNGRDYAYDLTAEQPVRFGVTPEERRADRALIRQSIDEIAHAYRFVPPDLKVGP